MRKLHNVVADAVVSCLARYDGVLATDVLDYLLSTEAQEIALHAEAAMRKGLLSLIRTALKETTLDDGVASGELTQMPLPGYRPPTTLPVQQPGGEYRYVRFEKLTNTQFLQALTTRELGILQDQKRLRDLKTKYDILSPYLLQSDTMTVEAALRLLEQNTQRATP